MAYRIIFFTIASLAPALALASSTKERTVSYEDAQVWQTPLRNQTDVEIFQKLHADGEISVWILRNQRADYMVFNENRINVHRMLQEKNLNHTILIMNVQRKIEASNTKSTPWTDLSLRVGHRLNFESYPTINIIEEYLDYLKDNYPSMLCVSTIGNSVEKRAIKVIHITNGDPSNKAIVIIAGQHAREWVGITSALYIANNIVTKYDRQPDYIKNKDWYIIPLMNPDGYAYSQTTDRLWRKNRRKNSKRNCRGVDINRNFPKHWHVFGLTQNNQCEEDYAGPFALSEPETLALLNMMDSFGSKVPDVFVDLHSYGQMILFPWSVSSKVSEHQVFLRSTANIIKSAIYNATRSKYTYGTPSQLLYSVSGTAIDWIHSKGVTLSYSLEIRDAGTHGFLLPSSEIEGTGKEMLGAMRALAKTLDPPVMRDGFQHRWF